MSSKKSQSSAKKQKQKTPEASAEEEEDSSDSSIDTSDIEDDDDDLDDEESEDEPLANMESALISSTPKSKRKEKKVANQTKTKHLGQTFLSNKNNRFLYSTM